MKVLVVINDFEGFTKGEQIKDAEMITEILGSEVASHVVVTETPEDSLE